VALPSTPEALVEPEAWLAVGAAGPVLAVVNNVVAAALA
jgi:hypothetical protein